jgi:hypothetical protein
MVNATIVEKPFYDPKKSIATSVTAAWFVSD